MQECDNTSKTWCQQFQKGAWCAESTGNPSGLKYFYQGSALEMLELHRGCESPDIPLSSHNYFRHVNLTHSLFFPPSKGNWRAKRWDFSKRDPKCDNSWCGEQLTQHLGLGGFTFQREKLGKKNKKQSSQNRACSTSTKDWDKNLLFYFAINILPLAASSPISFSSSLLTRGFRRIWMLTPHWGSLKMHFPLKLNQQNQSFLANLWVSVSRW